MADIKLKNTANTEFSISHNGTRGAKAVTSDQIVVAVETINDFPANPESGDTVIVKDINRGGTFIYDGTQSAVNNRGTNFNGWIRQYSGAVNVKWFGADIQRAMTYAIGSGKKVAFDFNATIRIPTDSPTLQQAIDSIEASQGVTIDLLIESGHQPTSGISVSDGDYAHFYVKAEDGQCTLSGLFTGRFIECNHGIAPVLDCYVIAHSGVDKVYSMFGSIGKVTPGSGGEGTSGRILYGNTSNIEAAQTVWKYSGDSVYFSGGSSVQLGGVLIEGFIVESNGALVASRGSSIEAVGATIKDCLFAVEAKRAGSSINIHNSVLDNISRIGIRASRGASVSFDGGKLTNLGPSTNGAGIEALGANISAQLGVTISYSSTPPSGDSYAVRASNAGSVTCSGITITGARTGLYVTDGGKIDASIASIVGASTVGAQARQGGNIVVRGATITNSGSSDLRITEGSIISAVGCTTTNGNPSVVDTNLNGFGILNSIVGNRGIIFG